MSKLIACLRAQWMGALAFFLVIAGGTAYAANTVGSTDIVNGEVKSPDIGNNQVKSIDVRDDGQPEGGLGSVDIANDSLTGGDIADGSVGSGDVADGSLQDGDLAASALGARAFGLVLGHSCGDPGGFCTIVRGKRVAYAAHVGVGKFCIGVNGINATDPGALAVVNPNLLVRDAWAEWHGAFQNNSACVGSEFEIYTGRHDVGLVDNYFTILIP